MVTLEQINDHRRTFPDFTPDNITARSIAIQADLDFLESLKPVTSQEDLDNAVTLSEQINTLMLDVKDSDFALFESLRKKSFDDLVTYFGV